MPRANIWADATDDRGSATLEFLTVGLLLLVPLVYLIVALGQIQGHALGVEAAARHIARALSMAPDHVGADARARMILAEVSDAYDLDPDALDLAVTCAPATGACPQDGATVSVRVTTRVPLPLAPAFMAEVASVPIAATAQQRVSRYSGQ
ncbi:hypothetical protein GCM10009808_04690 [Microbacterium sediminicola]|uniref:TadE family protein n=1 Tax=Microbacterium sediminicola TaxID=415210 RepID=A0ABP4TMK1_9MICO